MKNVSKAVAEGSNGLNSTGNIVDFTNLKLIASSRVIKPEGICCHKVSSTVIPAPTFRWSDDCDAHINTLPLPIKLRISSCRVLQFHSLATHNAWERSRRTDTGAIDDVWDDSSLGGRAHGKDNR